MFSDNSEDASDVATCVRCTKFASHVCQTCGDFYCSAACQKLDWRSHRYICRKMPKLILREEFEKEIMAVGHPLQEVRGCLENNCAEGEGSANNSFNFELSSQKLQQKQNIGKNGRTNNDIQQGNNVSLFNGSSSLQRGQESPQLHNTEGQYGKMGKQQFNHDRQQSHDPKKRFSHGNQYQFKRDGDQQHGEQFHNNEPYRQANNIQKWVNQDGQQQHNSDSALKRNQQHGNSGNKGSQNYDAYEPQYTDRSNGSLEDRNDRNGDQQQGKQQRGPQQCNDGISRRSCDNNQQRSTGGQQQRNYDGQQQRNNDGQRQRNNGQQRVQDGQQPHNNNCQQQRNNNGQQQQRNNDGQQQQRNNGYQQQQRNLNGQQQRNNDSQQQQRNYSGQQQRNNDGQQQQRNYSGQQQRNNGGQQQQQQRNNNGQQLRNNDGQQQQRNYNGQQDQNNSDSQDSNNDRRGGNEGRQWHNRNSQHDVPQQNRPDSRNISNSNSPQQTNANQNRNPQNYSENRQRNYQSSQSNQGHNDDGQQERQFNRNERQGENVDQSTIAPVLKPPFEIIKLDENDTNILARIIDTSFIKEGLFACIPEKDYPSFINLQMFLKKMDKSGQPYKPVLNEYCLALYEEEWYRAEVIGAYGNEFKVEYIDFTNQGCVTSEDIRRYPLDLTNVNSTSLCKLAGLPDKLGSMLINQLEEMIIDFQKVYIQTVKKYDKFYEIECPVLLKQLSELGLI